MCPSKREAELKAAFGRELARLRPEFVVLTYATAGAPDRSITGCGVTTHWEFKHATPGFRSPGLQELTCMRLAVQGACRYVIWYESASGQDKRTLIVHPQRFSERRPTGIFDIEASCVGFDVGWLAHYVVNFHEGYAEK